MFPLVFRTFPFPYFLMFPMFFAIFPMVFLTVPMVFPTFPIVFHYVSHVFSHVSHGFSHVSHGFFMFARVFGPLDPSWCTGRRPAPAASQPRRRPRQHVVATEPGAVVVEDGGVAEFSARPGGMIYGDLWVFRVYNIDVLILVILYI